MEKWRGGENFLDGFNVDMGTYHSDPIDGGNYVVKMIKGPMSVWWDLDGVLREIDKVGPNADLDTMEEHDYYYKQWETVRQWLDEEPERLYNLPATEYCNPIFRYYNRKNYKMRIITCQPSNWRYFAIRWIQQRTSNSIIYFADTPLGKHSIISDNTKNWALVEDYPFFKSYENIILVDRIYNRKVECDVRVQSPKELLAILEDIEHGYDPWETCRKKREREESLAIYNRALQASQG